jgi:hypothetical protein
MPEAVADPLALFEPSARPSTEIGWQRGGTDDRGLVRLGSAVNALLGTHFGALINDTFDPSDLALTPSDPLVVSGVHRRWMVKTPDFLGLPNLNRRCRLQVYVAKGAGAGLAYDIYVNGSLSSTYTFGAGGLAAQWVTLVSGLELDDTVNYQEVRIEQVGWHGGSASTDYARAVRLTPNVWANIEDVADGWTDYRHPVPVSVFGNNDSAASWLIQAMQDNLVHLYSRRVPTLYASTGEHAEPASVLTEWTKLRADFPAGVTSLRVWVYGTYVDGLSEFSVEGYGRGLGTSTAKINPTGWRSITYDVSPRGAPLLRLACRRTTISSVCIYCEDADYGG